MVVSGFLLIFAPAKSDESFKCLTNMKKLYLLLAFLLPMFVSAAEVEIDGIYYNLVSKAKVAEVMAGTNKYTGDIVIPATVKYEDTEYHVTTIQDSAFEGCGDLTSVTIDNSITSIGAKAFYRCSGLTSVTIGTGVTDIGNNAFFECTGLTTMVIPDNVKTIGSYTFAGCKALTSITLPKDLTVIDDYLFHNCKELTDITIPQTVTRIGDFTFRGCKALASLTIPDGMTEIGNSAFYECEGLISMTIPSSVTTAGNGLFNACTNLVAVSLPNEWTTIPESTFRNCTALLFLTIPDSVTVIKESAFYGCTGLTTMTIPGHVKTIESTVFNECTGLTSVTLEEGVESIGGDAFRKCTSLAELTLPGSLTTISNEAFLDCSSLTSVAIPDKVKEIDTYAFKNCISLATVTIGSSVATIDNFAFEGCSALTSVAIPASVTEISSSAFRNCTALASLTLSEGLKTIGNSAFQACSHLDKVTIPNSVSTINASAFMECEMLDTLTLGSGVKTVSSWAFRSCENLKDIFIYAEKVPYTSEDAFSLSYPEWITLHVPEGSLDAYKANATWGVMTITPMTVTKYTLTYQVDGEDYKTYDLLEGEAITPEEEPTKEGYVFSGWSDIPETMPAEDVTITGTFSLAPEMDTIKIKATGKGTWCSEYDLDFTDVKDIKAYTATGYDDDSNTVWLSRVYRVPAGTGIMVKGEPNEYKIPRTKVKATYANFFVGNYGEAITIEETDGDMTNYYMKDGTFVKVNSTANIGTNRCYLQLPTSVFAGTRTIGIVYDDEDDGTTGIKSVDQGQRTMGKAADGWYNLQGQRVENPTKGIYIKNGKKVIVR